MEQKQIPQAWVGQRVELWTLTGAPEVAQDFGALVSVNELGIVFRHLGRGGAARGEEDVFYPWGVIYRIGPVVE